MSRPRKRAPKNPHRPSRAKTQKSPESAPKPISNPPPSIATSAWPSPGETPAATTSSSTTDNASTACKSNAPKSLRARAYETRATYTVGKKRAVYTKKDIDFIAAHVVPLDIFYIVPVEICTPAPMLRFYPHRQAKRMRLEPYREAWYLLEGTDHAPKIEIQASADETIYPDETYRDANAAAPTRIDVILSEAKDLCTKPGTAAHQKDKPSPKQTKPVRLPKSAAPWPIPKLKILHTRQGKRILPDPSET